MEVIVQGDLKTLSGVLSLHLMEGSVECIKQTENILKYYADAAFINSALRTHFPNQHHNVRVIWHGMAVEHVLPVILATEMHSDDPPKLEEVEVAVLQRVHLKPHAVLQYNSGDQHHHASVMWVVMRVGPEGDTPSTPRGCKPPMECPNAPRRG